MRGFPKAKENSGRIPSSAVKTREVEALEYYYQHPQQVVSSGLFKASKNHLLEGLGIGKKGKNTKNIKESPEVRKTGALWKFLLRQGTILTRDGNMPQAKKPSSL